MPPKTHCCKICRGKKWIGKRGLGRKQGWIRTACVCVGSGIGRPPLSKAILDAFEDAGSFEVLDASRGFSTKPPQKRSTVAPRPVPSSEEALG